jgi:hypothetical protein
MKIAPNKRDIRDYFVSWEWLVLIFAVVSYAAWFWPITSLDALKSNEKINFFFETYGLKEPTFQDSLYRELKAEGVEEVNFYQYAPDDPSLTEYYDAFGSQSDFLFLSENDLSAMFVSGSSSGVKKQFIPFSPALAETVGLTQGYAFYSFEGELYALKVFDAADNAYNVSHGFDRLLTFTKEGVTPVSSYLLLNSATPNFSPYDTDSSTGNGVLALKYFLSVYGGE